MKEDPAPSLTGCAAAWCREQEGFLKLFCLVAFLNNFCKFHIHCPIWYQHLCLFICLTPFFLSLFSVLETESRTSCMPSKYSATVLSPSQICVLVAEWLPTILTRFPKTSWAEKIQPSPCTLKQALTLCVCVVRRPAGMCQACVKHVSCPGTHKSFSKLISSQISPSALVLSRFCGLIYFLPTFPMMLQPRIFVSKYT